MLLFKKFGIIYVCIIVSIVCVAVRYCAQDYYSSFSMPSFITMKLPIFFAGMLCAEAVDAQRRRLIAIVLAAMLMCVIPSFNVGLGAVIRIGFVLALLILPSKLSTYRPDARYKIVFLANKVLASSVMRWSGDVSYGVYLLHLLLLIPVSAWISESFVAHWPGICRLFLAVLITSIFVYPVSYLLHLNVELRGVKIGRDVLKMIARSPRGVHSSGEL